MNPPTISTWKASSGSQEVLVGAPFASIVVTHDRYFLENVANHVAELNRIYPEGVFQVEGNYSAFLEKREQYFAAQAKQRESLAVQVRREVEWLRRGPKAHRKSKARWHRQPDDWRSGRHGCQAGHQYRGH